MMSWPTDTELGAAVIATARSACAVTGVVTVATPSVGFGSAIAVVAVAVLTTDGSAACEGTSTIVTVAVWPTFRVPRLAITSVPTTEGAAIVVVPTVAVPLTNDMPVGSGSVIAT